MSFPQKEKFRVNIQSSPSFPPTPLKSLVDPIAAQGSTHITITEAHKQLFNQTEAQDRDNQWLVCLIMAGTSLNRNTYSKDVLEAALPLFDRTPCFTGHVYGDDVMRSPDSDFVAVFTNPVYDPNLLNPSRPDLIQGGIVAIMNVVDPVFQAKLNNLYNLGLLNVVQGLQDGFGLSIAAQIECSPHPSEKDAWIAEQFIYVESVDVVFNPSAGGMFLDTPLKITQGAAYPNPYKAESTMLPTIHMPPNMLPSKTDDLQARSTILTPSDLPSISEPNVNPSGNKSLNANDFEEISPLENPIVSTPEFIPPQGKENMSEELVQLIMTLLAQYGGQVPYEVLLANGITDVDYATVRDMWAQKNATAMPEAPEGDVESMDTMPYDPTKSEAVQDLITVPSVAGITPNMSTDQNIPDLNMQNQLNALAGTVEGLAEMVRNFTAAVMPVVANQGASMSDQKPVAAAADKKSDELGSKLEALQKSYEQILQGQQEFALRKQLSESKLPQSAQDFIFNEYRTKYNVQTVTKAIEAQRKVLASVQPVQGMGVKENRIWVGESGWSAKTATHIFEGLLGAKKLKASEYMRLSEWYRLTTGDHSFSGSFRYNTENGITTSTVTSIVKNALNKVLLAEYSTLSNSSFWKRLVKEENFSTINDATFVKVGGIGIIPTVAEGAPYTSVTLSDYEVTSTFSKKGQYVGVSLETFMRDNLNVLRGIPSQLARAYNSTIASWVASNFTDGSGVGNTFTPTGFSLFSTNHANYGTTALSHAALKTARAALRKQRELGSNEKLGTDFKFLLTSEDLIDTAETLRLSKHNPDSGAGLNDPNLFEGKFESILMPHFSDTNNWYLMADPAVLPSIVIGWYQGNSTPELFEASDDRSGALFDHDEIRFKTRFWFAGAVVDYRGMYGSVVA